MKNPVKSGKLVFVLIAKSLLSLIVLKEMNPSTTPNPKSNDAEITNNITPRNHLPTI